MILYFGANDKIELRGRNGWQESRGAGNLIFGRSGAVALLAGWPGAAEKREARSASMQTGLPAWNC
jgi:hypothetical protein